MEEHEKLEHCRKPADQNAVERGLDLPQGQADKVAISFDWEIPALTEPQVLTFLVRISRWGRESRFRFRIDLIKLKRAEQEKLRNILATRHAGLDDGPSMTRSIEWLLRISLEQTTPQLSTSERQLKVRQLLLVDPLPRKQNVPTALGVSPLLPWVTQRARNRLRRVHRIDIDALECESLRLSRDIQHFKKLPPDSHSEYRSKADTLTKLLIAHHRKVKHAGTLLGGELGSALDTYATLAIKLLKGQVRGAQASKLQ